MSREGEQDEGYGSGEEPYEYVMPLSGSPADLDFGIQESPSMDRENTTDRIHIDRGPMFSPDMQQRWNIMTRRSSNQTDATPRFQNTSNRNLRHSYDDDDDNDNNSNHQDYNSPQRPIPRLPLDNAPPESQPDGNSWKGSGSANSNQDQSIEIVEETGTVEDSTSQGDSCITPTGESQSAQFTFATPLATRFKMLSKRGSSALQINMDGEVRSVGTVGSKSAGGGIPDSPSLSYSSSIQSRSHSGNNANTTRRGGKRPAREPLSSVVTVTSASGHSGHYIPGQEEDLDDLSEENFDDLEPIICCGRVLPLWMARCLKKPPSYHRISRFLVQAAPCFWCWTLQGSATDRTILFRLNVLCLIFTFTQLIAALWLAFLLLFLDEQPGVLVGFSPHLWNINGAVISVGILAFLIIITCFCTLRVIKEVDLVGAIRYLWLLLWLLPFESFFVVSLFDYHQVTEVWIRHWWREPSMSFFRAYFCWPHNPATLCTVPINGGEDFATEDEWCMYYYDSTECTGIRDESQTQMEWAMVIFYTSLAAWGCILLFLMLLMVNQLERIISSPIVQKARETNVPAWLLLPFIGNILVGIIFLFSPSSLLNVNSNSKNWWIGAVYLASGFLFFIALLMGWFLSAFSINNSMDKKTKNTAVVVFISVMACNVVLQATIFVASVLYALDLPTKASLEDARGPVACLVDRGVSCTMCDAPIPEDRCPEWTMEEVTKILQTQLKQSATLSAIFVLYAISVLRFGFVLRKHLAMYQIDYV